MSGEGLRHQFDLSEFTDSFHALKEKGWVRSERRGPTGIGHTLEFHLGLKENNIALPDLGEVELKAHRIGSTSMLTLFTFNRKAWKMKPLEAIHRFGTEDVNGRLGMYITMSRTPNSTGLFLHVDNETVSVRHISGQLIAEWRLDGLADQFMRKMPALILVSAQSEDRGGREWFKYERAQLLWNTSRDILKTELETGNVLIDLRLHDRGTSARNHGTGFRTYVEKLPLLYENVKQL